jgi:hypothetical protein
MKDQPLTVAFVKDDFTNAGLEKIKMIYEASSEDLRRVHGHYTINWPPILMHATVENDVVVGEIR